MSWGRMGLRRHGRGATGPDGPSASRAWCFTARKPLFLRRQAPRRLNETGPEAGRRGASPPANPYFFVVRHHVGWANRSTGTDGVVLHRPPSIVSSSSGTTSDRRIGARGRMAWCFTARKPLFLRRRAPRRLNETGPAAGRRGASPPANPCSFVVRHHVGWANRSTGPDGVVLHRPQTLVSSSSGTTPPISSKRSIPGTRPGFPEFSSPPKNEKCRRGAAPAAPRRHFPFSLSIGRDCPSLYIRGTVSILSYLALPCLALPCLLNFPKNKNGAEDEIRTRDPRLGKAMLYP